MRYLSIGVASAARHGEVFFSTRCAPLDSRIDGSAPRVLHPPQVVHPRPGGVEHQPGVDAELGAVGTVAAGSARVTRPPVKRSPVTSASLSTVSAGVGRGPYRHQRHPGVVHLPVLVDRPGREDWTAAQVNTPLTPGDGLYSAAAASVEVQIGPRAFVRAGAETEIGLNTLEPDYVQFEVKSGHVAVDVRSLEPDIRSRSTRPTRRSRSRRAATTAPT